MKARAALFDLDGVLVDTEPQYTAFWTGIGRDFFPELPDFAVRLKGQTLTYIFDTFFADDEEGRRRVTQRLDDFENRMSYPLIPGAEAFVERLRKAGWHTAVVTSSNRAKMAHFHRANPNFSALFDRIFTAEDAPRSKPAPDCYVNAARHFGLEPQQCVVFEDSKNGLRAGRESGAYVVGLAGSLSVEELRPLCHLAVEAFGEIDINKL